MDNRHIGNEIFNNGLVVLDNLDQNAWQSFNIIIESKISEYKKQFKDGKISNFDDFNKIRLEIYREINSLPNWENLYFNMAGLYINYLLGPDLLIQRKLNLSIQIPHDFSSILGMHADTLSGQSPFEIVLWVAMTDAFDSNSMFYFDKETSKEIFSKMPEYEKDGLDALREKYWSKVKFVKAKKSQVVLFSGTLFHGNIENQTSHTRISINSRFKNLYSPSGDHTNVDRSVGVFYKLFKQSEITSIGREYIAREIKF